jgi:hypothetical protein
LYTYYTRRGTCDSLGVSNVRVVDGKASACCSELGWSELEGRVFLQHTLHVVVSGDLLDFARLQNVEKSLKKRMGRRDSQLVFQLVANLKFHIEDFLSRVGTIRDVNAISNFGRIYFFVLASY